MAVGFLLNALAGAVVHAWIRNNTRRGVPGVIVFHFIGNVSGELMSLFPEARFVQQAVKAWIALAVLAVWGPGTLRRKET